MSEDQKNMEVSQFDDRIQIPIPQLIRFSHLEEIGGIEFTSREIDIISCIIRGKKPNTIALLLSIGPKNVENRIAGIKQKIGCRSQQAIIDFVEKSDQFEYVERYYLNLLILVEFEKALKKLSTQFQDNPTYTIIYDSKSKEGSCFIPLLNKHLELVGIKKIMEGDNYYNIASKIKTSELKQHYIICCLSKSFIESKPDILNIVKLKQEGFNSIIFISFEQQLSSIANELSDNQSFVDLTNIQDYYSVALKALKAIITAPNFDSYFEDFNTEALKITARQSQNIDRASKIFDLPSKVARTNKLPKKWLVTACMLLGLFFVVIWTFYGKKRGDNVNYTHYSLNLISRIEAKELCKLPFPCEYFTGREDFIDRIKKTLKENKRVVISGYQGMGKTQIAYQYAKSNAGDYAGGTYILKADSPQILLNSIRSFAIAMGLINENQINNLNDEQIKKITLPLIQNHLENHDKMLLVLDNVYKYDDIRDLISIQSNKHDIIITSCNKKWDAWNILELKEFDRRNQEAEKLILKVLKSESLESARRLAEKLGYYPLAITQAVNYLKNNSMINIDDYIREYDSISERRKAFLDYSSFEQNNYLKTTVTAFEISKNTLIKELGESYLLLKLCAYFSHDVIPASLFKHEIKNLHGALEVLNKYSLVDISNINGELHINMHNVLRDNIKIHISEANETSEMEDKVINLLDRSLIYDFWDNKNIDKVRIIMPHVDHFLKQALIEKFDLNRIKKVISIYSKSGAYYIHCLRDSSEAIRILEKAKKLIERNDPTNKHLSIVMEDLATAYYYFGEYHKARQEIDLVQRANGATELSHLIKGHILYNECRYDDAEEAYNKVLKLLNKSKNTPYLAIAHRSLGLVFYRKSQFSSPEKSKNFIELSKHHLETALEMHTLSNSENLELAISKHAYGRTAVKLKEIEKAERALADALRIATYYCRKDEDHYEALVIKRSYGHFLCMNNKKRFDEGLKYLQQAFDGKILLFKDKPHQAVIGTIELIIDVYSHNPTNKELRKMMPRINQYIENWTTSVQQDDSKQINKDLMNERIYILKETINNVNRKHNIVL